MLLSDSSETRDPHVISVAVLASTRLLNDLIITALATAPDIAVLASGTSSNDVRDALDGQTDFVLAFDGSSAESLGSIGLAADVLRPAHVVVFGTDELPDVPITGRAEGTVSLVPREGSLQDIVTAIRKAGGRAADGDGIAPLDPDARTVLGVRPRGVGFDLTAREREVARLLAQRYANADICRALAIRPGTLKAHVHSLYLKLGISRREDIPPRFAEAEPARLDALDGQAPPAAASHLTRRTANSPWDAK